MATTRQPISVGETTPGNFFDRRTGGNDGTAGEMGAAYHGHDEDALYEASGVNPAAGPGWDDPPRPVVWPALTSDEAEFEWLTLNEWVEDLRVMFNLDVTVVPPFWHRHPLLVEHLSALRTHWLAGFDPEQHGSAPFGWLRDLDEWKNRMREAVSQLGCRIDSCRPQQRALWPGEPEPEVDGFPPPPNLADRYDDFVAYVLWDVHRRHQAETCYYRMITDATNDAGEGL
jgi:hypothetical protein